MAKENKIFANANFVICNLFDRGIGNTPPRIHRIECNLFFRKVGINSWQNKTAAKYQMV